MKNIIGIAKKEWLSYFSSPVGFVFAGLLLLVTNWLYFADLFISGQADLKPFWNIWVFLLSIFVPAISMNLIAEEKKNSTWEVLLSLPIKEWELVCGKFLGSSLYLIFTMVLALPTVVTVYFLGKPDLGILVGGLLGTLMIGLAYLSLGLLMSSLTSQPIVSFLASSVILLINSLMGQEMVIARLPSILKNAVVNLSIAWKSANFSSGLIALNDFVFFISWICIMIVGAVLVLKSRGK